MIKIQMLLRHPSAEPELDQELAAELVRLGIRVLGVGRATLSAEIAESDFEGVFGLAPHLPGHPGDTPDLPIPKSLQAAITLITLAPRHVLTAPTGKENNAAI